MGWISLRVFLLIGFLMTVQPVMSKSNAQELPDELASEHRFFVGMYRGTFPDKAQAVAAAGLPSGSVKRGEFGTADGAQLLVFKSPPKTTDTMGLEVLVLEQADSGAVRLWLSTTDLSRPTQRQAQDDVENFKEIGGGSFRVFERK